MMFVRVIGGVACGTTGAAVASAAVMHSRGAVRILEPGGEKLRHMGFYLCVDGVLVFRSQMHKFDRIPETLPFLYSSTRPHHLGSNGITDNLAQVRLRCRLLELADTRHKKHVDTRRSVTGNRVRQFYDRDFFLSESYKSTSAAAETPESRHQCYVRIFQPRKPP